MNMNMDMVENSEPDGHVNWDDDLVNDSDGNSSSSESLVSNEEPVYSFSNMYGPTQTTDTEIIYDPPASNTRRRKKAH